MVGAVSLRPALRADYEFLRSLHERTMRPLVERSVGWNADWQALSFEQRFDPDCWEVAECDGTRVGAIWLERRAGSIQLLSVEVEPAYQNRGIGTCLIEDVLQEADRSDRIVECEVLKDNPALALLERLGFQRRGETPTHLELRRFPDRAA